VRGPACATFAAALAPAASASAGGDVAGGSCAVVATIGVGKAPTGVAVNPHTGMWYVPDQSSDAVSVIRGRTGQVVATVPVFGNTWYAAVETGTDRIYVTDGTGPAYYVSVIDGRTSKVIAQIPVQPSIGIAVDPRTDMVYAVSFTAGTLQVINGRSESVVATVAIGSGAYGVAVDM
jgi:DNA-binding beta-propeller fold protein YncE